MFCFFLFGNAEVKRYLCYNAIKHGVLASLKILLENKLELEGDDWGKMVSTCMHPRYSLDSGKCMPLLKITGNVIEVWNFRSQFLCNRLRFPPCCHIWKNQLLVTNGRNPVSFTKKKKSSRLSWSRAAVILLQEMQS